MPVSFDYQVSSFLLKRKKQLVNWILLVAYVEKKEIEKIDFVFCSDEFLLELNRKFLSHKTYTDILTFDYSEGNEIMAEIYISIDRVKENALKLKVSFEEELHRVMIHGVLHCFGYEDKKKASQKKIRRKEDEYLRLLAEM